MCLWKQKKAVLRKYSQVKNNPKSVILKEKNTYPLSTYLPIFSKMRTTDAIKYHQILFLLYFAFPLCIFLYEYYHIKNIKV